ncbi:hypothetical protein DRP43_01200 [candidate division TA06 bacterium]|uniref:DUF502 domain-containing protein n=1 Tax=candidate division TA06 bacterium TaxID=2250710 RepID=A0A660SNF7_UNCT6|nr:MAG: hypothetical protein DRP43_01200 [candidate division TA06 bacterium]
MKFGFKQNIISGFVAILPLAVTILITYFIYTKFTTIFTNILYQFPLFKLFPPVLITVLGLIVLFLILYLIGFFTNTFLGRWITNLFDKIFMKAPLVNTIYNSARSLSETLFKKKTSFKEAVLVQFPRNGGYTIGFVTTVVDWLNIGEGKRLSIFIPTTPNPTSGFFLIVKESEVMYLDISVEWALKIIVSGGIIHPDIVKIRKVENNDKSV